MASGAVRASLVAGWWCVAGGVLFGGGLSCTTHAANTMETSITAGVRIEAAYREVRVVTARVIKRGQYAGLS